MKQLSDKDFFRVDEVAAYFDVSSKTVRRWIDDGKLNADKLVGIIRIPRSAILDFISSQRQKQGHELTTVYTSA